MNLRKIIKNFDSTVAQFPTNTVRKNFFLATCLSLDENTDLFAVNKLCPYGGIIGMGNSKLDNYLKFSKVIRVHAVLHDAAGFMKEYYDIGPGYCYAIPKVPFNSPFLGHISGILYCLYLSHSSKYYVEFDC